MTQLKKHFQIPPIHLPQIIKKCPQFNKNESARVLAFLNCTINNFYHKNVVDRTRDDLLTVLQRYWSPLQL